jgi:hypothetical protein
MTHQDEIEARDSACEYWEQKGKEEAYEEILLSITHEKLKFVRLSNEYRLLDKLEDNLVDKFLPHLNNRKPNN